LLDAVDRTCKFAIFIHVAIFVHHVCSWDTNIVEEESGVVDSVEANFQSHVSDFDSGEDIQMLVSNGDEEGIDAFVSA
jgi:hypothetical protein